jgi:energy-coupling factor transporter ATP-binding protein EcfA2
LRLGKPKLTLRIIARFMNFIELFWIFVVSSLGVGLTIFFYGKLIPNKQSLGVPFLDNNYIDAKKFYLNRFKKIPNEYSIYGVDIQKCFNYLDNLFKGDYEIHQRCNYDHDEKKLSFSKSIIIYKNIVFEIASSRVSVLVTQQDRQKGTQFINEMVPFLDPPKEGSEINIISKGYDGLELKKIEIMPTDLDISLYYNDDFKEVDKLIKERLTKDNDKGIILLHGMPGTGKTTYLRHLIGFITKKVLFVSPTIASNLTDPDFVDMLISNPNCVLIIEDAENIIMDRKNVNNQSVSNLLNISDGLLSDCLNVQIICTFNTSISNIDSALLRKGRLVAQYKFDKLTKEKAQKLSDSHGFNKVILEPKTIAEVMNQNDPDFSESHERQKIGFGFGSKD